MTLSFKIAKCTQGVTFGANCDWNFDERRLKRVALSQKEKTFLYIPAYGEEICDLELGAELEQSGLKLEFRRILILTDDLKPEENFSLPFGE